MISHTVDFCTVWIFLLFIEGGFALVQKIKGKIAIFILLL